MYIIYLSKPFEILKKNLGTQIMLQGQFVDLLEYPRC
jgi:hypothetical protein